MERKDPLFDAPIPGQSMLHELGARPWQNPPQYTTLEEVVDFYVSKMATDEVAVQIADILEMDVSVVDLAHTMQLANVMEGVHTIDVSLAVKKPLMEFIAKILDAVGVPYAMVEQDLSEEVDASLKEIDRELQDLKKNESAIEVFIDEVGELDMEEEPTEEAPKEEAPVGLMARGN